MALFDHILKSFIIGREIKKINIICTIYMYEFTGVFPKESAPVCEQLAEVLAADGGDPPGHPHSHLQAPGSQVSTE